MARRREDTEGSFWISYSDLTTGLLLVFILLVAVLVEKREQEMQEQKDTLTRVEEEVREMLSRRQDLSERLEEAVDTTNGEIGDSVFAYQDGEVTVSEQEVAWFISNSAALTPAGKAHIRAFYRHLYDQLLTDGAGRPTIPDYLASIEIQGHTDPVPRAQSAGEWSWESYNGAAFGGHQQDSNLYLSQLRAKAILDYIQDLYASGDPEFDDARRPWKPFVAMVEATGRSWTRSYCAAEDGPSVLEPAAFLADRPCEGIGGNSTGENRMSRRVTFSFRLDDAEILGRLRGILEAAPAD